VTMTRMGRNADSREQMKCFSQSIRHGRARRMGRNGRRVNKLPLTTRDSGLARRAARSPWPHFWPTGRPAQTDERTNERRGQAGMTGKGELK
jgi:hypothetical protein